jgi:uncharacterized protein YfaS (alpha-2-macroglobulin family)
MFLTRASDVVFVLLLGLCLSSITSHSANVYAVEAGLDTEVKVKVGSEVKGSSDDQANVKDESDVSDDTEMSAESKNHVAMKSSYQKASVDSRNSVAINTQQHLYNPGEEVKVDGTIWTDLISQIGGVGVIKIQVVDNKDTVVYDGEAQVSDSGTYSASFVLPSDSQKGAYTIKSNIDVSSDVFSTLTADVQSSLQTSSKFVVANGEAFAVNADGKTFDVNIESNSDIGNFEFKQDEKRLTFTVEGESGTQGVTQITVPKAMLSGQMAVMIDGEIASSDDVIISSDTEASTTLEINYHHSIHTIDVTGTNAVPEFPLAVVILVISIVGMILIPKAAGIQMYSFHRN